MGISKYKLILAWYLFPFLYLVVVENIILKTTAAILIAFTIGITTGYFSFNKVSIERPFRGKKLGKQVFTFLLRFTLLLQLYGFYRVAVDGFDIATYRLDFFEGGGVFKSTYLFTLYSVFLIPLFLLATMFVLNDDLSIKKNRKIIWLAFLVIVIDGILRLGRFQYLFVIFFLYLTYRQFGFKKITLVIGVLILLVVSFTTIYIRQFFIDAAVSSSLDIVNIDVLKESILNYQYIGYFLLEHFTKDKSVLGTPLEANTISFLPLFLKYIVTKFGMTLSYPWETYNLALSEGIAVPQLGDLPYNAFATNFFPVYLDLGLPGVFLYGLFSGIFLGIKSYNQLVKAFQFLNIYLLFFGLYQPIITTLLGFVLIIGYMVFLVQFIKKYFSWKQKLYAEKLNKA